MAFTLNVYVTRAMSPEIFAEKLSKGSALPYIDSATSTMAANSDLLRRSRQRSDRIEYAVFASPVR